MQRAQKNLQLIQLLRGIATILVLLYHITSNSKEILGEKFIWAIFEFVDSGVYIFFVLSSLIIAYSDLEKVAVPSSLNSLIL